MPMNEWPDNTPTPGEPHYRAEPTPQTCRGCGCTDDSACSGGCAWVSPDLCSACTSLPAEGVAYACPDCPAVFPVDPDDPMVAHGNYLDHFKNHDADLYEAADTEDMGGA